MDEGNCVERVRGIRPFILETDLRRPIEGDDFLLWDSDEYSESVSGVRKESVTILKPFKALKAASKSGDGIKCDPGQRLARFKIGMEQVLYLERVVQGREETKKAKRNER